MRSDTTIWRSHQTVSRIQSGPENPNLPQSIGYSESIPSVRFLNRVITIEKSNGDIQQY